MDEKSILRLKDYVEELNLLSRLCDNFDSNSEADDSEIGPLGRRFILIADGLVEINEDYYRESFSLQLLGHLLTNYRPHFYLDGDLMPGLTFFLDSILHGLRSGGRAANPDPEEGYLTDVDTWLEIRERGGPAVDSVSEDAITPDLSELDLEA